MMARPSPIFVRIHPLIFEHDKFRQLDPRAFQDWMELLTFSARQESDGFVSKSAALDYASMDSIEELIKRNLLDRARMDKSTCIPEVLPEVLPTGVSTIEENRIEIEDNIKGFTIGYVIHDYTDHQTSKAEIESRREVERQKSQARRNKAKLKAPSALKESESALKKSDPSGGGYE